MLDRTHRITRSGDFTAAVRRGRRAGGQTLVLHLLREGSEDAAPKVGFVVGKGVGHAVTRNQVKRRLRHLLRDRLDALPDGALLVVRALPGAAGQSSWALAAELDRALARSLSLGGRR